MPHAPNAPLQMHQNTPPATLNQTGHPASTDMHGGSEWSNDLRTLPVGLPTQPVHLWVIRALALAWTPHRLAFGVGAFLFWSLHGLLVPDGPQAWGMLASLLGGSLLGSIFMLAMARSMALELACARKPPIRHFTRFAREGKRSAACTGLFFALISVLLYLVLIKLGSQHPPAVLAGAGVWWILTGLGTAAMASDGSDSIDAIQRAIIYVAHRPLTAISTLWPALLLIAGLTAVPFLALPDDDLSGMAPLASLLLLFIKIAFGGLCVSLLMGLCVGSHLALRHANDGQEPAELWQSGSEGGVLKPSQADHGR